MTTTRTLAYRRSVEVDGVARQLFVASTAASDRMSDVVDQATWRLDNYRANPVVLTDHEYTAANVVGRGEVAVVPGVGLTLDVVKWSAKPYAQEIKQDVEDGVINAVSVGFRPGRRVSRSQLAKDDPAYMAEGYGEVYYDCELLEISIVAVPANPEAVAVRAASKLSAAEIADMVIDKLAQEPALRGMFADILAERSAPADDLSKLFQPAASPVGLSHLFPE